MSILPPATGAHSRDQIGRLNIPLPDELLSPGDQEAWRYYVSCLPPDRLIEKFAEALDRFHALIHPIRTHPEMLDQAGRDALLSHWNAAAISGGMVTERFGFDLSPFAPGFKDAVSEGLFFLNHMLRGMEHPSLPGWVGRETYYNDVDPMIIQDIRDDYFERQGNQRHGRKYSGFHLS